MYNIMSFLQYLWCFIFYIDKDIIVYCLVNEKNIIQSQLDNKISANVDKVVQILLKFKLFATYILFHLITLYNRL